MRRAEIAKVSSFAFGLMLSCSTYAGEYFMIDADTRFEDRHQELCTKLVNNFNFYKSESPMVCIRKFHPKFAEFKFPDWELVNADAHFDNIKRLLLEEGYRKKYFEVYEKLRKKGWPKVWVSRFDYNSDGSENFVYRLSTPKGRSQCTDTNNNQGSYRGALHSRYLVEQNVRNNFRSGFWTANGRILGDVFFYKGRTYFHSWEEGAFLGTEQSKRYKWPFPRILIREGSSPTVKESFAAVPVCEIGYREN